MTARQATIALLSRIGQRGISLTFDQAAALRRAEKALHRWGERECGDGTGCIERDEATGKPYWLNSNTMQRVLIADREKGALKRVAKVCKDAGLHFFHQTDPRGCALYISAEELTDSNYSTRGVPCCED